MAERRCACGGVHAGDPAAGSQPAHKAVPASDSASSGTDPAAQAVNDEGVGAAGASAQAAGGMFRSGRWPWRSPLAWFLIALIQVYRYAISPMMGRSCRFAPSCSAYAMQAVQLHGGLWGSWLAVRRIGRCHPWNPGGYDPVPPKKR